MRSSSESSESLRAYQLALKLDLLRRLKEEEETHQRFSPYRDDPLGFIGKELREHVWSKQREVCQSLLKNRRTAVPSCHDSGKSFIASRIASWWIATNPPGEAFIVTTAPTFPQVRAILWREISRAHKKGNLPGRLNQTEWWIDNELVGFGRKPDDTDPSAFQGIHARRVLVLFDEAGGIPKALWDAAETLITNEESRLVAIGNPDDPTQHFAEVCKPGSEFNVIRISAFDTPNFTGEEIPERIRPLLLSKLWVEEKRKSWGEDSMLWTSKVLGQFPENSTDSLVPISAITAAVERKFEITEELRDTLPNELGFDIARFGSDSTVGYHRNGPVARVCLRMNKRDLMTVCGAIVLQITLTKARRCKIDDSGLGGGVTDRLQEIQSEEKAKPEGKRNEALVNCEIVPVNVGEAATTDAEKEHFANLRAQVNWAMRARFIAGDISLPDADRNLLAQASNMKYGMTSRGQIKIESKDDMKERGLPSPDDWDALVLVFADPAMVGDNVIAALAKINTEKAQTAPLSQFTANHRRF